MYLGSESPDTEFIQLSMDQAYSHPNRVSDAISAFMACPREFIVIPPADV